MSEDPYVIPLTIAVKRETYLALLHCLADFPKRSMDAIADEGITEVLNALGYPVLPDEDDKDAEPVVIPDFISAIEKRIETERAKLFIGNPVNGIIIAGIEADTKLLQILKRTAKASKQDEEWQEGWTEFLADQER